MIDRAMIGKVALITWARFGVKIEKVNELSETLEIFISVPEHSYHCNVNGKEMSGAFLARRFKTALADFGVDNAHVKFRIRSDESWTEDMAYNAEAAARKQLLEV